MLLKADRRLQPLPGRAFAADLHEEVFQQIFTVFNVMWMGNSQLSKAPRHRLCITAVPLAS